MQIIINIATTGDRQKSLDLVIKCFETQTIKPDQINVYDNSKEDINLTDNGKFYFLQFYKEPVYYFTADDDILYPTTYIEDMIKSIEEHKCIVTHHGRTLIALNRNYYRGHKAYRCLANNIEQTYIDVAGTGVSAFRTDYFNPVDIYKSEYKQMSDLVFSLEAARQSKKIMVLKHISGYLKDLSTLYKQTSSCFNDHINTTQKQQISLANEIYKLKLEKKK